MTEEKWRKFWSKKTIPEASSPYGLTRRWFRHHLIKYVISKLPNNLTVIDLGCGKCDTLKLFYDAGFRKLYGIDISCDALKRGVAYGFKIGENLFVQDAKHLSFKNKSFDVVFEEGMWEHFTDPEPYVKEACRITKHYLIAVQPDHYTILGSLSKILWVKLMKNCGGVKENTFPLSLFKSIAQHEGLRLKKTYSIPTREDKLLLFVRP